MTFSLLQVTDINSTMTSTVRTVEKTDGIEVAEQPKLFFRKWKRHLHSLAKHDPDVIVSELPTKVYIQ